MRFAIIIVLCAIVLLGGACDGSERVREEIRKMQQCETHLCLSDMSLLAMEDNEEVVFLSFDKAPMKLVVYVDSALCSSCLIKNMYHWYDVIDKVEARYHGKMRVIFIFDSSIGQLKRLEFTYRNSAFRYPIFVDTVNVFRKNNPHIPDDNRFHTFLLDEKGKVVLVGSPLTNVNMRNLFFKEADRHLCLKRLSKDNF